MMDLETTPSAGPTRAYKPFTKYFWSGVDVTAIRGNNGHIRTRQRDRRKASGSEAGAIS